MNRNTDTIITNRIQKIKERISDAKAIIEKINSFYFYWSKKK